MAFTYLRGCYSEYMRKTTSGFTIVELIIVIIVIAILSTIVIVAYGDFQARSQAAGVESNLKTIEKSLRAYASEKQWSTWPTDTTIDPGKTNPTIQNLITDISGFKTYLTTAPITSDLAASAWVYDYDSDTKASCSTTPNPDSYTGTNIVVTGVKQKVANYLDSTMDDGNLNCGRIRYDSTALKIFYSLSYTNDLSL
jgi:prepilin-type N-terminal cleavage/methylation domain-containing protein